MKYLAILSVFLALPVAAQTVTPAPGKPGYSTVKTSLLYEVEPYASASVADFSKAGYVSPYIDAGAGIQINGDHAVALIDGYYSPTRKIGVPGSASTVGGSFDALYRNRALLIGGGVLGGQTQTSEFRSHAWRWTGELGFQTGEPTDSTGRVRVIAGYVAAISDSHNLSEYTLAASIRWRHVEPFVRFTNFGFNSESGRFWSYQLGVRVFPF